MRENDLVAPLASRSGSSGKQVVGNSLCLQRLGEVKNGMEETIDAMPHTGLCGVRARDVGADEGVFSRTVPRYHGVVPGYQRLQTRYYRRRISVKRQLQTTHRHV